MLSKNFIFFIFILLIFFVCIIFLTKLPSNETFYSDENNKILTKDEILKYNLKLVNDFSNQKLIFTTIQNPNKDIVKYQAFYHQSIYPQLNNVDCNVIQNELYKYIQNSNDKWIEWPEYDLWKNRDSNTSWKVIPLMSFGKWSDKNTKIFPETTKQLKQINGLVSVGFSKLGPNTTLTLHKGWGNLSNNVLRCHLGLIVPKNKCKIFVIGNSNYEMIQKENKWIIFDDSLYHSASNNDNQKDRIVLILDIKRPNYIPKGESDIENSPELNNFVNEFNKNL